MVEITCTLQDIGGEGFQQLLLLRVLPACTLRLAGPLQPLAALGEGSGAPLILGHLSDHHFAPQQQQQQQPTPAEAVLLPAARTAMAAGHKQCLVPSDVGVVLVHGFGGGVFAWRHLLQPLADAVGVRVVAFDRPGFGEHMLAIGTAGGACAVQLSLVALSSPGVLCQGVLHVCCWVPG